MELRGLEFDSKVITEESLGPRIIKRTSVYDDSRHRWMYAKSTELSYQGDELCKEQHTRSQYPRLNKNEYDLVRECSGVYVILDLEY